MRKHLRKILKEAGFTVIGSFMKAGIGFIITAVIARFVLPEVYGTFTQAFTIITILMVFASIGIPQAYTRYIPLYLEKQEPGKIAQLIFFGFVSTTLISVVLMLVVYMLAPALAVAFDDPELTNTLRWLLPLLPMLIWIRNMLYVFISYKELRYAVYIHRFILPTVKLVFLTVLFYFSFSLSALIVAELAATGIAMAVLWFWYQGLLDLPERSGSMEAGFVSEILGYALPLVFSQFVLLALSYADIIMLGLYLDSDQVGIYKVVLSGAYLTTFAYMSLAAIFKPVASGLFAAKDQESISQIYRTLNRWGIFFNGFLILVVALFGREAIRLMFTEPYVVGYSAMLVLTLGYAGSASFGHAAETLEAVGRTKVILFVSIGASLLNVGLNAVLIPVLGMVGGAIATAAAAMALTVAYAITVYRKQGVHAFSLKAAAGPLAFFSVFIPLAIFGARGWSLSWVSFIFAVAGVGFAYGALLLLFRGFDSSDKEFFSELIKKRRPS